jgi:hypothetical protein
MLPPLQVDQLCAQLLMSPFGTNKDASAVAAALAITGLNCTSAGAGAVKSSCVAFSHQDCS